MRASLPDEPESPARARELLARVGGVTPERIADARLLLHELVATALYDGVEFVEVRVMRSVNRLRFEVAARPPHPPARGDLASLTAAQTSRRLVANLSDRFGDDGMTLWCELDGTWKFDGAQAPG